MKKSSNTTGSGAPESDSQLSEKIHRTHSPRAAKIKARKDNREISATKIQKAWFVYVDKTLFKLLKHTVCAAEYCVAHELLKKVSPIEAALLKDPSMKCKVRFRFSGETFPPCIVFKIFLKSDSYGYKYFSGKNVLKPSSKHPESFITCLAVSPSSENLLTNRRKTTGSWEIPTQHIDPFLDTSSDKNMENQNSQNRKEPADQRHPLPEENPRMKCRDCGAFGHTVRSRKCPIKCWDGAKAPLPLGVKKEKENQDPQKKPQNPQSLEPENETEREREERERLEKRKKALLLRFPKKPLERKPPSWKDLTHSGDYLRRPSRPTFIHINRKLSLIHTQVSVPGDEKSDDQPVCQTASSTEDANIIVPLEEETCQTLDDPSVPKTAWGHSDEDAAVSENPTDQSPEYCFHQVPQAALQVQEMGHMFNTQSLAQHSDEDQDSHLYSAVHTASQDAKRGFKVTTERNFQAHTQIIPSSTKKFRLSSYKTPKKSTEGPMLWASRLVPCSSTSEVEPKRLPQGAKVEQQPPHNKALLNFTQSCMESHRPLTSHVPVQPVRMVFTRLRNDCWSSKILEASSFHITEKKLRPDKISLSLKHSGGLSHWVCRK